jgi:hypothetical protein
MTLIQLCAEIATAVACNWQLYAAGCALVVTASLCGWGDA